MNDIAIKVEDLGKKYIIRHEQQESYKTFQDLLIKSSKRIITSLNPFADSAKGNDGSREEFWALKDVNFEINKGDKVGIIGRNGAGKSTLLKVLSRITEPTTGRIRINGRIASLLEVGTGFHPELTGRENIYLNGAILGMSRAEIKSKFDEIVAFAEIEKFLDTPVKRYSSGMYVRLAFSVAAHLEPEILVVDEVLAVGDIAFQKKCLGKMQDVSEDGRTILFVSHNMGAIAKLCNKGIYLESGAIGYKGDIQHVITRYQDRSRASAEEIDSQIAAVPENDTVQLLKITVEQNGTPTSTLENGQEAQVSIEYLLKRDLGNFHIYFRLLAAEGGIIFETLHEGQEPDDYIQHRGRYRSVATLPGDFFNEGNYTIEVYAAVHRQQLFTVEPIRIPIHFFRTGVVNRKYMEYRSPGMILPHIKWSTRLVDGNHG